MTEDSNDMYQSFLLRCWRPQPALGNGTAGWRFALRPVSAESDEQCFRNLEQLMHFIATEFIEVGDRTAILK